MVNCEFVIYPMIVNIHEYEYMKITHVYPQFRTAYDFHIFIFRHFLAKTTFKHQLCFCLEFPWVFVFFNLKSQCHLDFDLCWSKLCCNNFAYLPNNTETPRERIHQFLKEKWIMVCSSPVWKRKCGNFSSCILFRTSLFLTRDTGLVHFVVILITKLNHYFSVSFNRKTFLHFCPGLNSSAKFTIHFWGF